MSKWDDKLDDYIENEEDEALDEIIDELVEEALADEEELFSKNDEAKEGEEDITIIDIFGSQERADRYFRWLDERAKGSHIINPKKVKEVSELKRTLREIFGSAAKITVGVPDIKSRSWSVTVKGKNLKVNSPMLLKRALIELADGGEFLTTLNGEASIIFTICDATVKLEEC